MAIYVFLLFDLGLLSFGLAQLVYALLVLFLYCRFYARQYSHRQLAHLFCRVQDLQEFKKKMSKRESQSIFEEDEDN